MHLTKLLQFYKHRIRVPGQLFQGKNKAITRISVESKRRALNRLLVEQDNLDILNKPFLSVQEEHGHMKEKNMEKWQQKIASKQLNMLPHKYIRTELEHVNCSKKWDES